MGNLVAGASVYDSDDEDSADPFGASVTCALCPLSPTDGCGWCAGFGASRGAFSKAAGKSKESKNAKKSKNDAKKGTIDAFFPKK